MVSILEKLLSGSNNTKISGQKIKIKETDRGQPMRHQQMKQAVITPSKIPGTEFKQRWVNILL